MIMEFLICTNNSGKLEEMKRILDSLSIKAYSPRELGIDLGNVEETGNTFKENAYIKARAGLLKSGMNAIADDSGLCVDALDKRPGVYTARYGGESLSYPEKCELLLSELRNVPKENRGAEFCSAISVVMKNGDNLSVEGVCRGEIGYQAVGENGFGYDPIFMVGDKSFAELSAEEKDALSHRGRALQLMKEKLTAYLKENR